MERFQSYRYDLKMQKRVSNRRLYDADGDKTSRPRGVGNETSNGGLHGVELSAEDVYSHFCDQLRRITNFYPPLIPLLHVLSLNP